MTGKFWSGPTIFVMVSIRVTDSFHVKM